MGKKKQTVGYWYHLAFHHGLGIGPCDAFLEFRGGDKVAWKGKLTESGTITIDNPNLWGGEKDQGGIVGELEWMSGAPDQLPNAYLSETFGDQQPAWRGLSTVVFRGGKYGAMNPYPQKPSYKIRKIKLGWGETGLIGECWYPETAAVGISEAEIIKGKIPISDVFRYQVEDPGSSADYSSPSFNDSAWPMANGGFGSSPPDMGTLIPAGVLGKSIWLRKEVPGSNVSGLQIDVAADDGAWLWWNGAAKLVSHAGSAVVSIPDAEVLPHNVVVLKVVDGVPSGSPTRIFAGLELTWDLPDFSSFAMNPAHILYYARTHPEMGREPIESINEASFTAAADWFYAQNFGLCTEYDPSKESVEEFEQRICRVAGCGLTRSLIDGQWYIDVANGEYDIDALPVLSDDDILDFEEQPTILDSVVNSVSIKYFDPGKKETITTAPAQAPALIADFGTNHLTIDYPEIPTAALAARVAQRELLARITPLRAFSLKSTRTPYTWRPSTYFRLQAPKRRIADMVCLLGEKSSGVLRSGAMSLNCSQDIYSMPAASFIEVEEGVDTRPDQTPAPIVQQAAFEAPYVEVASVLSRADLAALPPETSYLLAVAADPSRSRDYTMMVDVGGGYEETASGDWCATALVVEAATWLQSDFTLSAVQRGSEIELGMPGLWGTEIVRVDALDLEAGTIALARGCADTVPVEHPAGQRIWFYATGAAVDPTEYAEGEALAVRLLTNTGSQRLPLAEATPIPVTMTARPNRPYPPGAFTINGAAYPAYVFGVLSIGGAHRDRVLQADQLIDTTVADIGPEAGTEYTLHYYANGVLEHTQSGVAAFPAAYTPAADCHLRIEVESVRGGVVSYQKHVHECEYTSVEQSYLLLEGNDNLLLESGDKLRKE